MNTIVVADELQGAGLYDPTAPNASEELNLLRLPPTCEASRGQSPSSKFRAQPAT